MQSLIDAAGFITAAAFAAYQAQVQANFQARLDLRASNLNSNLTADQQRSIRNKIGAVASGEGSGGGGLTGDGIEALPETTAVADNKQLIMNKPEVVGAITHYNFATANNQIQRVPVNQIDNPAQWATLAIPSGVTFVYAYKVYKTRHYLLSNLGLQRSLNLNPGTDADWHYLVLSTEGGGWRGLEIFEDVDGSDKIAVLSRSGTHGNHVFKSNTLNPLGDGNWQPFSFVPNHLVGHDLAHRKGKFYVAELASPWEIWESENTNPLALQWGSVAPSPVSSGGIIALDIHGSSFLATVNVSPTNRVYRSSSLAFDFRSDYAELVFDVALSIGLNSGFSVLAHNSTPNVAERIDYSILKTLLGITDAGIDIHGLVEEAPDENSEWVFNKHTPAQPILIYTVAQRVEFQRDGATNNYDLNLPPPNAPRRNNKYMGDHLILKLLQIFGLADLKRQQADF